MNATTSHPFTCIRDPNTAATIYQIEADKFPANQSHMFYPFPLCEEHLVAAALEYSQFPPSKPKLSKKFNVEIMKFGDIPLIHCSFPTTHQKICLAAAQYLGLQRVEGKSSATRDVRILKPHANDQKEIIVRLPYAPNVLHFSTPNRNTNKDQLKQLADRIIAEGLRIHLPPTPL